MNQDVPWLYVLSAVVSSGGFARQKVIAVASDPKDLETFFYAWLERNRDVYGGRTQIDCIPFVSETDDDA
jgi:hypothetical protein